MIPGWVEPACYLIVGLSLALALRAPETRGRTLRRFALLALAGFVGEASCVRLYGFYSYSPGWAFWLDVVPLAVVLVWPVVILSALELAKQLSERLGGVVALTALIVFTDAALIEPVAVHAGLWSWTAPGLLEVPPIGVLGWAIFAAVTGGWFAWLDRSQVSAWIARRAELALLLLAPVAVHVALLTLWWGALRWVSGEIPARYGVALAWTAGVALAARALRGPRPQPGTVLVRAPGAAVFFVLLAQQPQVALIAFVLAFPLPYLVLTARGLRAPRAPAPRGRLAKALGVLVVLAVIAWDAFLLGPVPEVDASLREPELPASAAALTSHLAAREARFSDITPGAEATIVWADPKTRARTPLALVYLHGFTATRQETAPLCDEVAAQLGANLYYPRLTGHGRTGAALGEATVNDWLNDAYEAYRVGQRLGERVVLLGVSTGGTLAAWLATRPEVELEALVLISPNFAVRAASAQLLHAPWGSQLAQLVVGPERSWKAHNADHERYWTTRYPTHVLLRLAGLLDLVAACDLGQVRAPTLVVVSPDDTVIDPGVARARFAEITSEKRFVEVANSQDPSSHVLAGRILAPDDTAERVQELVEFIR